MYLVSRTRLEFKLRRLHCFQWQNHLPQNIRLIPKRKHRMNNEAGWRDSSCGIRQMKTGSEVWPLFTMLPEGALQQHLYKLHFQILVLSLNGPICLSTHNQDITRAFHSLLFVFDKILKLLCQVLPILSKIISWHCEMLLIWPAAEETCFNWCNY